MPSAATFQRIIVISLVLAFTLSVTGNTRLSLNADTGGGGSWLSAFFQWFKANPAPAGTHSDRKSVV